MQRSLLANKIKQALNLNHVHETYIIMFQTKNLEQRLSGHEKKYNFAKLTINVSSRYFKLTHVTITRAQSCLKVLPQVLRSQSTSANLISYTHNPVRKCYLKFSNHRDDGKIKTVSRCKDHNWPTKSNKL